MLPPYATEVEAPPESMVRLGNEWSTRLFDGPFYQSAARDLRRPSCALVFVQSADGNTGADDPGTLGGGETDKHLIYEGLSRAAADGVLAGAETIRGADVVFSIWQPELIALRHALGLGRHPAQIVATLRGVNPDDCLLFNIPEIPVFVLTAGAGAAMMRQALTERPWVTPVVMDRPEDLPRAFEHLAALGLRRVSCVGGRHLARQLLNAGLVDDVYLTTSPRRGGERDTPLIAAGLSGRLITRKRGTGDEAGVRFEHVVTW
jgi:riboflavin biosynthesis pyrimidine reductase